MFSDHWKLDQSQSLNMNQVISPRYRARCPETAGLQLEYFRFAVFSSANGTLLRLTHPALETQVAGFQTMLKERYTFTYIYI